MLEQFCNIAQDLLSGLDSFITIDFRKYLIQDLDSESLSLLSEANDATRKQVLIGHPLTCPF